MLTYEKDFVACVTAINNGERVEIDEEMFMYWLEVLPPVYMRRNVTLPDGKCIVAAFGFAEGAEKITAFWTERIDGQKHIFCQRTNEMHDGG